MRGLKETEPSEREVVCSKYTQLRSRQASESLLQCRDGIIREKKFKYFGELTINIYFVSDVDENEHKPPRSFLHPNVHSNNAYN